MAGHHPTAVHPELVRDAAGADPDMAEQWATNREQRMVAMRLLAELVADRGRLKPGLTTTIEVYSLLTADRAWSPARWQRWMADTLADALLAR